MRLDNALVARELVKSRTVAKRLIQAGRVTVNGKVEQKAARAVTADDALLLLANDLTRYVSRAGYKLAGALEQFKLSVAGKVCLDIGASTGGFSDCLLQNGAAKVYAVDVGRDQLDEKLRNDSRIVNRPGVNIRAVTAADFDEPLDVITVDVSFISLALVLPVISCLMTAQSTAIILIKPQFEVGKAAIGKGIVKDAKLHVSVLKTFVERCRRQQLNVRALTFSSIKGNKGNVEFIACVVPTMTAFHNWPDVQIDDIVNRCHDVHKINQ